MGGSSGRNDAIPPQRSGEPREAFVARATAAAAKRAAAAFSSGALVVLSLCSRYLAAHSRVAPSGACGALESDCSRFASTRSSPRQRFVSIGMNCLARRARARAIIAARFDSAIRRATRVRQMARVAPVICGNQIDTPYRIAHAALFSGHHHQAI